MTQDKQMPHSIKIAHITDLHARQIIEGSSAVPRRKSRLVNRILRDALSKCKRHDVDLVIFTGDIVDVPLPHQSKNDQQVIDEYKNIKSIFDSSGIATITIPGNHDELKLFHSVFPKNRHLSLNGFDFISFYDHQDSKGNPIIREGSELEALSEYCNQPGPRNQIHLQHYLITPELNQGWPHTYDNANDILTTITQSKRVLLSLSGHYHGGVAIDSIESTSFLTSPSFSEEPYPFSLITITDQSISVEQVDMKEAVEITPIDNPYDTEGSWYQGNLHTHCKESSRCSTVPLIEGYNMFKKKEYDFLAITDHDTVTELNTINIPDDDIVLFEGLEHSASNHMLFIDTKIEPVHLVPDKKDALKKYPNYLSIVCHPQGPHPNYWTVDDLLNYPVAPTGVEVFNGHYSVNNWRQKGAGWDYTDFWDECLNKGLKFFAYANDDFHDGEIDLKNGWNVVLAKSKNKKKYFRCSQERCLLCYDRPNCSHDSSVPRPVKHKL